MTDGWGVASTLAACASAVAAGWQVSVMRRQLPRISKALTERASPSRRGPLDPLRQMSGLGFDQPCTTCGVPVHDWLLHNRFHDVLEGK